MNQKAAFKIILAQLENISKQKPVRVAVNGIEGVGKTTFAEHLTSYLNSVGKSAIHVSIDGFHFDKKRRYKKGRNSAIGYYEDAYNEEAFLKKVLLSSQKHSPEISTAIFDLKMDTNLNTTPKQLTNESIIITDGAYLFKPIFVNHWDFKIYLKSEFKIALQRAIFRDSLLLGGINKAKTLYKNRYHKASKSYIKDVNPERLADIIFDNTDFNNPKMYEHS